MGVERPELALDSGEDVRFASCESISNSIFTRTGAVIPNQRKKYQATQKNMF